jgi:hypothetical protein
MHINIFLHDFYIQSRIIMAIILLLRVYKFIFKILCQIIFNKCK